MIRICGRKTRTLPTPPIRPSTIRLCSSPSGRTVAIQPPICPNRASIPSIAGAAQVKTAWNMTKSTPSRMARPATGCSRTLSILPVRVSGRSGGRTQAFMMRSASRWAARISAGLGAAQWLWAPGAALSASAWTAATSSLMPRLRVATVVTTGTPSDADSCSRSILSPWRWAMSYIFSAMTIGRPTCFSSRARRRTRRRLVASATQTTTSGGVSPASCPRTASRVTSSSRLRARRE